MSKMRTWRAVWLPLLLMSTFWMGQTQAQTESCFRVQDLTTTSAWQMKPSGSVFQDGEVVGWVNASSRYYMPIAQGNTVLVMVQGRATNNRFDAVPLTGMPGLGLRVRWLGYSATSTLTPVAPGAPYGTIISNRSWFSVLEARTQANYTLTEMFMFELVVIDQSLYKGGKLTFTESGVVTLMTSNRVSANSAQLCVNGWIDAMSALTGTIQVPELPQPVQPTCHFTFGTLNQRVSLGGVDPGQVAPYGSARSAGYEGQSRFNIHATDCNKGTVMHMYLTDNRDGASRADYLSSTKEGLGVRLYFNNESSPVRFGPAPVGANPPSRTPIIVGPIPFENIGVLFDFVAQYVRIPGAPDVTPGPMQAEMTFTVIYP